MSSAMSLMALGHDVAVYHLVWASFTNPMPEWALGNLRTSAGGGVHVHCATQNCTQQVQQLGLARITATPIRVSAWDTHDHPLSPWFVAHALMKVWYGADYPHLFDLTVRLAILYEGGVVLDVRSSLQQQLPAELLTSAWCAASGEAWVAAAPRKAASLATALAALVQKLTTSDTRTAWREHVAAFFTAYCGGNTPAAATASLSFNGAALPPESAHFAAFWFDARTAYLHNVLRNPGVNLGDEVQGLAALQWLPFVDSRVERDDLGLTKGYPMQPNASTAVFLNGWYGTSSMTWPPAPNLVPVMLAVHIETPVYNMFRSSLSVQYLQQHAPIGARDTATLRFLTDLGVPAFLSYCMTITLQQLHRGNTPAVDAVIVDVSPAAARYVPMTLDVKHVSPKFLDNGTGLKFKGEVRYWKAFELLRAYGSTRVLVTSRLHAALPAFAMGVPVVLVLTSALPGGGGHSSNRFSGLQQLLHSFDFTTAEGRAALEAFPWHDPPPNPGHNNLTAIRCNIYAHIKAHHSQLLDVVRAFDVTHIFKDCA